MFKTLKPKCIIPRAVKKPAAFSRWLRMKWMARVRAAEKELGGVIECC